MSTSLISLPVTLPHLITMTNHTELTIPTSQVYIPVTIPNSSLNLTHSESHSAFYQQCLTTTWDILEVSILNQS